MEGIPASLKRKLRRMHHEEKIRFPDTNSGRDITSYSSMLFPIPPEYTAVRSCASAPALFAAGNII
jgi:hypothetical protein